ncbi:lacticin 481 family lantibiotic [Streptococcus pyogenes]|uniref:lacticin 481 family lantibiotic n=1 Tax=Streptococcus pyogenes TaxID=1314 RepID=UPI00109C0E63|nr:lacticin 481 family lantibiotic [Streptococcus pyogenes]VGQ67699.1 Lantibiotic macedocin [Streptococcus pyogenes]VHC90402.1 Lantibiotic macedocin [Streptococcus pyogenes]
MEKNNEVINSIQEVSLEELDQIIGAGKNGVFKTISHECHLNTWVFLATCCS